MISHAELLVSAHAKLYARAMLEQTNLWRNSKAIVKKVVKPSFMSDRDWTVPPLERGEALIRALDSSPSGFSSLRWNLAGSCRQPAGMPCRGVLPGRFVGVPCRSVLPGRPAEGGRLIGTLQVRRGKAILARAIVSHQEHVLRYRSRRTGTRRDMEVRDPCSDMAATICALKHTT